MNKLYKSTFLLTVIALVSAATQGPIYLLIMLVWVSILLIIGELT